MVEYKTLNQLAHLQFPIGSKILVTHPQFKNQSWLYKIEHKEDNKIGLRRIFVTKSGEVLHFKNCLINVDPSWFEKEQKRNIKIVV